MQEQDVSRIRPDSAALAGEQHANTATSDVPSAEPKESAMTEMELVREYFPKANSHAADLILWSCTAYPCCGLDITREQLGDLAARCGPVRKRGWFRKVILRMRQIDREMTEAARAFSEMHRESLPTLPPPPAGDAQS